MKIKLLTCMSYRWSLCQKRVRKMSWKKKTRTRKHKWTTECRNINFEDACWGILAWIFNFLCSQFCNLPGRKSSGALVLQTKSGEIVLLCLFYGSWAQEIEDPDWKNYPSIFLHFSKVSLFALLKQNLLERSAELYFFFTVQKLDSFFSYLFFLFSLAAIYNICYKAQRIKSCILYLIS